MKNRLETDNIPGLLVRTGVPAMLGMMVIALYNVVDTYYISGLGTEAVAAASVVFPIVMGVSAFGFAFGTGAASWISRLLGEGEEEQASIMASTAFYSALGTAALAALAIGFCMNPVLRIFGARDGVLEYAELYGLFVLAGSVVNVGTVTANNMLRAEGLARQSMITMSLGAAANMALDPLFIYGFGWGIRGAAFATVLAQSLALAYVLVQFRKTEVRLKIRWANVRIDGRLYGKILSIGIPVLVYQGLNSIAMGVVNQQAAPFGSQAVAAMGIVVKVVAFMSYVVYGFVKGLQPIAGYNYGAGRLDRVREATRWANRFLTVYCLSAAGVAIVFAPWIARMFSDDSNVLSMVVEALRAWSAGTVFLGFQMTYVTLFLAIGMVREGSAIGLSRQGLLLVPLLLILTSILGFRGILWAQPLADLGTFALAVFHARRVQTILGGNGGEASAGERAWTMAK